MPDVIVSSKDGYVILCTVMEGESHLGETQRTHSWR